MATEKKVETVTSLSDKLKLAKAFILVDYRGLKHKQLEELRKILKKSNAELMIAKNRLFLRSLGENGTDLVGYLKDTTAILFEYSDEVAPIKDIMKFFKSTGAGKIKAGMLGIRVMNDKDVLRLSTLPGKEVLLSQLAGQLNAPIQGLHNALSWNIRKLVYALDGIKVKKGT